MVAQLVSDLESALSQPRLAAYRPASGSDLDMIVNYFWNIDLAEAIVPSLHAFEVALRNTIHDTMRQIYNTDMWFFLPGVLEPNQLKDLATAYGKVYKRPHPTSGRLVAALMFGFWTSLLHSPYEQKIWSPQHYAALQAAFPEAKDASGSRIARIDVQKRLELINDFRNRVFHYERIYEWEFRRNNAPEIRTADKDHKAILEAIEWISPALCRSIKSVDEFAQAWAKRPQIESDLMRRFGITSSK